MNSSLRQLAVSFFFFSLLLTGVCLGQTTERVSVDSQGVDGIHESRFPSISADGRYVAFQSHAYNLVPGDTNWDWDIFVHDRQTGVTERVSVDSQGVEGSQESLRPSISANGRYVSFWSHAPNLVSGDTNGSPDVFVHDRQTGVTERVSVSSWGVEGDSWSGASSISFDGRYVAFESWAGNFVSGDSNDTQDIFIHDRQTGVTTRVSVDSQGIQGSSVSSAPSISGDGRYVAFGSQANNLAPGEANGWGNDVFVHDLQTGATERISMSSQGAGGNSTSYTPSISFDGRYVAFESQASNLVPGDSNGKWDIFIHDRQVDVTERVSVNVRGIQGNALSRFPSISFDGRYVAFESDASNLVPGDTNGVGDLFIHDRQAGVTERVSVNSQGVPGNGMNTEASMSAGGHYVAFVSKASNLVPGDTNGERDVFVHDRWNGLGANSIYLTSPTTASVGVPLNLVWATARPNSSYWLAYSMSNNGAVVGGHTIDISTPHTLLATGVNSGSGTGSYLSPPVPASASGLTVYFEVVALDANGILYDSNALAIDFN